jgi:hypothetical protein
MCSFAFGCPPPYAAKFLPIRKNIEVETGAQVRVVVGKDGMHEVTISGASSVEVTAAKKRIDACFAAATAPPTPPTSRPRSCTDDVMAAASRCGIALDRCCVDFVLSQA